MTNGSKFVAAALAFGLLASASAAVAQGNGPAPEPGTASPDRHGSAMMGGQDGGVMGMMGGADAAQMNRMMENCNRMMESRMQGQQQAPGAPASPVPERRD
jgi:periplasmic protein CpxP/Spy